MVYQPDLEQTGPVKLVGYLSRDRYYPKGETTDWVFDRLVFLAMQPLYASCGVHHCDLDSCESDRPRLELKWRETTIPSYCSSEILVPDGAWVYVAPALILHYIRAHRYLRVFYRRRTHLS
jgi:hypothetical protein